MKGIKHLIPCIFVTLFSQLTWGNCGLEGTVIERMASCKHLPKLKELTPITSNKDGIYYYQESEDIIISPLFLSKMPKRCILPFKKSKSSKLLDTPKGSYRCLLKNASRFILLTNEKIK